MFKNSFLWAKHLSFTERRLSPSNTRSESAVDHMFYLVQTDRFLVEILPSFAFVEQIDSLREWLSLHWHFGTFESP